MNPDDAVGADASARSATHGRDADWRDGEPRQE